jgi:rhodanese-related sulfurtransferase
MLPEINVRDLSAKLKGPNPPLIVDVRQPDEYQFCRIEGALLRPLNEIGQWSKELDPEQEIVLQCHTGVRSAQAVVYLRSRGFKHVFNLRGGIDAWSVQVDPTVRRY